MSLESNSSNSSLKQNANSLVITPNKDFNNGSITYRKIPQNKIGASIIYHKSIEQSMMEFHLDSTIQATMKVNVIKLGNLQVTKIDEETGNSLYPKRKLVICFFIRLISLQNMSLMQVSICEIVECTLLVIQLTMLI